MRTAKSNRKPPTDYQIDKIIQKQVILEQQKKDQKEKRINE